MALSSCAFSSQVCVSFVWFCFSAVMIILVALCRPLRVLAFVPIDWPRLPSNPLCKNIVSKRCLPSLKRKNTEMFGQQVVEKEVNLSIGWSSLGGSRIISRPNVRSKFLWRKSLVVYASWLPSCQIASNAFTLGTVFVLPFYTLMVIAPRAEFTKKLVSSCIPYLVLGGLYAYLLYLSWTPDTIRLMFASKYWLPELSGIATMFTSKMTLASAWIHLLAVDLFSARQIYYDGLQNNIETRHSVSLCLMFCPIGILAHFITKALSRTRGESRHEIHDWQQ